MADDPEGLRRGAALQRAVDQHGNDTIEEFSTPFKVALVHAFFPLVPFFTLLGTGAGAVFTKGWLFWVFSTPTLLLAWPAFTGLAGALYIFSKMNIIVLIYKNRMVWIRGSKHEVVNWDDIAEVNFQTHRDGYQVSFEPPVSDCRIFLETPAPLAYFWREWFEVHTNDERVIRLHSAIDDYEGLSRWVQCETNARIGPPAQKRLQDGKRLHFGPLVVHRNYVELCEERFDWSEYGDKTLFRGLMGLVDRDNEQIGRHVPSLDVPNLGLAFSLITELERENEVPKPPDDEE